MKFVIETNIPGPMLAQSNVYPFDEMPVGGSFALPVDQKTKVTSAVTYRQKKRGEKFTVRKDGDGYRCWRLA